MSGTKQDAAKKADIAAKKEANKMSNISIMFPWRTLLKAAGIVVDASVPKEQQVDRKPKNAKEKALVMALLEKDYEFMVGRWKPATTASEVSLSAERVKQLEKHLPGLLVGGGETIAELALSIAIAEKETSKEKREALRRDLGVYAKSEAAKKLYVVVSSGPKTTMTKREEETMSKAG